MSGVTDSHKTAASVQSEKSVESAEPAEIVAVTQGETERRMSDLSAPGRGQQPRQRQTFRTRQLAYTPARRHHGRHVPTRFTTATWSPPPK